ncbi:NrfD/PsrC family molybdoenzyme membrane anchor subunit [Nonomuraea jiangxiensis]|uniref:Formate-dependent nitrite reductase, membrane component NrfD n=1 Tax=Nonomuraea jiangxiensis TaxID=633440 RepID=A0A1G9M8G6_9ACTN|nr:NrfD/PsrC family molybdoenzyme membrane anchor subunit [Nonomuraea jiangxiensis]SDL70267.1 Formate-dependent nitrite reductase, membrane component NrfD [Nonomuraea jiangxiensis]
MSQTDVRLDGSAEVRTEREATPGSAGHRRERPAAPRPSADSYYGRPVLNEPTWQAADIAGYLFLGGLAGASSTLAAAAELTGRPHLARVAKVGALGALGGSLYALIHDLGRPDRFVNMLRVFKVTSPMSVGTWILTAYGPQAGCAAAADVSGLAPRLGRAATLGAGLAGPAVATYTAALICDTAVPAWHEGFREMPFLFAGSATAAAGGLGMLAAPLAEAGPARRAALLGAAVECVAATRMERRLGPLAEPLKRSSLLRVGEALSLLGALAGITAGRRSRIAAMAAGAALLAGSACTRFGIFRAGMESANDPKYTVQPQRRRLAKAQAEADLT